MRHAVSICDSLGTAKTPLSNNPGRRIPVCWSLRCSSAGAEVLSNMSSPFDLWHFTIRVLAAALSVLVHLLKLWCSHLILL